MDVASLETARQEDAVRIPHQVEKALARTADDPVFRFRPIADPSALRRVVDQVGAPDDPDIVELETLRRVHASHLIDAARVVRPMNFARNARREPGNSGASVPGAAIVTHDHVLDQLAARKKVLRPRPAKARRHPGGVAFCSPVANGFIQRLRRGKDAHLEGLLPLVPKDVSRLANAKGVVDPVDEPVGARAPELRLERIFVEATTVRRRRFSDECRRADFAWAHDLPVVDEEDRHLGRVEDLLDLAPARALRCLFLRHESVRAVGTKPVRLVANQDVDLRGRRLSVVVEIAELGRGASPDDPVECLRKGARPGGVLRIAPHARQLRHQLDRQHGLSRPGAAVDEKDVLDSLGVCLRHRADDPVENDLLFVEQDERRFRPDDFGNVVQQLLARAIAALLDTVQHGTAIAAVEPVLEVGDERIDIVRREDRRIGQEIRILWEEERIVPARLIIVQVRACREQDRLRAFVEGRVHVGEIVAVLANLGGRMEDIALAPTDYRAHDAGLFRRLAFRPLLQLDDHCLVVSLPIPASDETVKPA